MRTPRSVLFFTAIAVLLLIYPGMVAARQATPAMPPKPPGQPATGPGGAETRYPAKRTTELDTAGGGVWLYEPASGEESATPVTTEALPLVLMLGGCCDNQDHGGTDGSDYGAWIEHLVRRGAVVISPRYRADDPVADAIDAMRASLTELSKGGHAAVDPARVAVFGHSYGAATAALYTARAAAAGVPVPAVLVIDQPGGFPVSSEDLARIPATTKLLILVGDQDTIAGDAMAKRIWAALPQIPLTSRDYVAFVTDGHGSPRLVADHFLPITADWPSIPTTGLDALDWYGTWKLTDALMACAFAGQWCEYALGNTPEQRFMGTWSDGMPVAELTVTDDPGLP